MILVELLAAYFTLFSAGLGVALLIHGDARRLNVLEFCCLAWLFGCGVVSLLLWLCGTVISGIALQAVVAVACIAIGIAGWRVKQRAAAKFTLPVPNGALEWLLGGAVVVEIATILFVSSKHTLGWDGLLNWEIKARYAFLNGGVIPAAYYSSSGRAFSHPEYPLGIPFTELWLYLWMGEANQFWVKTIFPVFYAVGAILLALLIARISGQRWSGVLVAALFPFIPYFTAGPGGVIVAYADFPLSIFYLTAVGYLVYSMDRDELHPFLVYAGSLALLPWIKREGLIMWFVLVFLGMAAGWRRRKLGLILISSLPGLLLIAGWHVYLMLRHAAAAADFSSPALNTLRDNLGRITPIFRALFVELSKISHWSIFWLFAGLALAYLLFTDCKMRTFLLVSSIAAPIVVYCLSYVFSTWPSYTSHITASLPRLLLHLIPVAWLAIGIALPLPKSGTATSSLSPTDDIGRNGLPKP